MELKDLVGKAVIRHSPTKSGNTLFYNEPCLLLGIEKNKAIVCTLYDTDDYSAAQLKHIGKEFFDDAWFEYGNLLYNANMVRAQLVARILEIMGIQADEESLQTLCRAVSYKQFYDELKGQLALDALISALSPTIDLFGDDTEYEDPDLVGTFADTGNNSSKDDGGAAAPPSNKFNGFVRRG